MMINEEQRGEDSVYSSFYEIPYKQKKFNIPRMHKRLSLIEKYVKLCEEAEKTSCQKILTRNGNHLEYQNSDYNSIVPIPNPKIIDDQKSYIKYSSLNNHLSGDRINLIEDMGTQYQRLKSGLSLKKDHQRKQSLPLIPKRHTRSPDKNIENIKIDAGDIERELKKSMVVEKGKKYYADLLLLKKERDKMAENAKRGISVDRQSEQLYKKEEAFIIQKKKRQLADRKNKMIKSRNSNWNVYYEALALNNKEKRKFKEKNLKFVESFGTQ